MPKRIVVILKIFLGEKTKTKRKISPKISADNKDNIRAEILMFLLLWFPIMRIKGLVIIEINLDIGLLQSQSVNSKRKRKKKTRAGANTRKKIGLGTYILSILKGLFATPYLFKQKFTNVLIRTHETFLQHGRGKPAQRRLQIC